jgi:DMSO/TMAO reductase YedYZ molybdopterin-dependent catalytic subunit
VRLRDVLNAAGVKESAVYTAHYGADRHLSGDPEKNPVSRGVPIEKAMDPHNLVAWAINGETMPLMNGRPLRLVVPGWPGSCSQKWLTRITLRDQVHDGAKMTGSSYRVPKRPVMPGATVADEDMAIIESLPVKSLITFPQTGVRLPLRDQTEIRGHAWAGDLGVEAVDISLDFGASWTTAALSAPANKYAWQRWRTTVAFEEPGYYEIWARARDSDGKMQPPLPPGWNPKGYLNNMQHRIAVFAV